MNTVLISGPDTEPVRPVDLRSHLHLDASHDALLGSLIAAARMTIEAQSGLRMINQNWRLFLDDWSDLPNRLPVSPVRQVKLVKLVNGVDEIISPDAYELQRGERADRLVFSKNLPPVSKTGRGIEIDLLAGFGAESDDVPADLRHAILSLAAHWYDVDDWQHFSAGNAMPPHVRLIVDQHRMPRLA